MAIAYDLATAGGVVDPGTSLTWSHTCSGSDLLLSVVGLQTTNTSKVSGITYDGVAMTAGTFRGTSGTPARGMIQYTLINPSTGAHNVVANFASCTFTATAVSYTGCQQSGQPQEANTGTVTGASSITVSISSQASGSWIIGGCSEITSSGSGYGVGTNTTSRNTNTNFGTSFLSIDSNGTTTTSQVFQWTGSDNALMCISEILEASGGGSSGPANLKLYNTNLKANIKSINTNLIANCKSLNTNV